VTDEEQEAQFQELVAIWRDLGIPAETILKAGVAAGVLGDWLFDECIHQNDNGCGHSNTYRSYNECVGSNCPTVEIDGWYIIADNPKLVEYDAT
jgi:hypothetical protein